MNRLVAFSNGSAKLTVMGIRGRNCSVCSQGPSTAESAAEDGDSVAGNFGKPAPADERSVHCTDIGR